MSTTEEFVGRSRQQVDRMADWVRDRIAGAPDLDAARQYASGKSRQTVEAARDRVEELGKWLGDLAVEMKVVEPPKKTTSKKVVGGVGVAVVAAGGWYFFNPKNGKERRLRVRNYFGGLRDRVRGNKESASVFVDSEGDLIVVDERKVAGLEGMNRKS